MPKCELDNEQKINLRELESAAKQSFNDMHTVTSIFKSALRTALRDAPLAYLVNEDYKALLIEDYRKILNETIGLDFDYQILNNDLETVS
ncbi:MAG: hypothetical protein NTW25_00580 [Candidatus Kapabacteria bacterium]|nr:hypothetical protein [Candidatus Kapabacteria bacterium]